MKLKTVLTINAIVALAISIALVLAPSIVISIYGGATDTVGQFLARHYGATGLAIGVLTWLARNMPAPEARRAMLPALLSVFLVELGIDLLAQLGGLLNTSGW